MTTNPSTHSPHAPPVPPGQAAGLQPPVPPSPATLPALAHLSTTRPVRLRIGTLIDGVSDHPRHNIDIVFDAHSIRSVEPASHVPPDAALPNHTLLPTLIEAHAHLFLDGAPINFADREQYLKKSPDQMLARARSRWPRILRVGIGAVRDAGDRHGVGLALAREAKPHIGRLAPAPYLDSPGSAIHHRGRYGAFMGEPIEDHASPAACALARIESGADRIKLLVSGIINFREGRVTTPPQMSIDEVRAIVDVARQHGKQTFAHASGADGVENSIEGGVTTVEHGFFITEDQLKKMRDRQIAWVPTFAPVQLQIDRASDLGWSAEIVAHLKRIIDAHRDMLRTAHEIGVPILAGSDAGSCGVPHGLGLLQELHQMEQAGLPPMAVLRAATATSAAALSFPDPIGRIAPGCRARFILTLHDPLKTVANLQREKIIIFDGQAIEDPADGDTAGL